MKGIYNMLNNEDNPWSSVHFSRRCSTRIKKSEHKTSLKSKDEMCKVRVLGAAGGRRSVRRLWTQRCVCELTHDEEMRA